MIPQQFIEEVQTRTDIVELISNYFPLKRSGRNFKALCPFHNEKTPSFFVSPQKQIFHCFGCGEGGGSIQFLMLYEKVSFVEAIEILAKRLGLRIPYEKTNRGFKNTLYEVVNEASLFFHQNLLENKNHREVLDYLNKRGIDLETIKKFRIGFAPGKNLLLNYLRKKNFTLEVMERTSLVFSYNEGWQDFFRQRIIFPIFDVRGRVIGFGARRYREKEDIPKYINSLENPLYSKRENLFGLSFAKDEIVKKDFVVVVEGYLDMIVPFMKEIKNIVASLGTALTLEQIRLIKRYTSNVVVVFDSDKAGQLASLRALGILLENDLKVKIVNLPSGYDPDSLVRESGKGAFLHFINKKVDFLDYKIEVLKNMYDIESIEGKTKISQEMLSTLDKLKSEVERYEYIKKLSQILKIKEEILLAEYRRLFSKSEKVGLKESVFDKEPLSLTEKIILKFMLTNEKAFSLVKENLKEEDFSSLARTIVSYLFKNFSRGDFCSSNFLAKIEDKKVSGFISAILMDDSVPLDKESFRTSIIKLKKKRVRFLREKLKEEIKKAELRGDREKCKELINKFYKINSEVKNG